MKRAKLLPTLAIIILACSPRHAANPVPQPRIVPHAQWQAQPVLGHAADASRRNIGAGGSLAFKNIHIDVLSSAVDSTGDTPVDVVRQRLALDGATSTADDLTRFAEALMRGQLMNREMTARVMSGYLPTEYGGRHGYGLETRVWKGVRIIGHGGGFTGVSNQVDFYPDLGYVLVVLGNTDAS